MIYNPRNWTQQKVRKKKIPVLMLILKGVYSWNKGVYSWNKGVYSWNKGVFSWNKGVYSWNKMRSLRSLE